MKIKNLYILISFGILIVSIFLLSYTYYKSEIIFNGTLRDKYNLYYILSAITLFFSIITFFVRDDIKNKIFLVFFSSFFALYLIEILFIFVDQKKLITLAKNININEKKQTILIDKRSRYEFFLDKKKINKDIVLSITPSYLLAEKDLPFLPLAGISRSETIMCNENGYYAIYDSDRYGFNNPDYEWDNDIINYFLIGDSYTHGACVKPGENISDNLRKISNQVVLNLGMGGNGPLLEYAAFKEYSKDKTIKNLLWIMNNNDFQDLEIEKKNLTLKKYFSDEYYFQDLKNKQEKIDKYLINFTYKKIKSIETYKWKFIKLDNTRIFIKKLISSLAKSKVNKKEDFKMFGEIMDKVKKNSDNNNFNLIIIYLPSLGSDYEILNYQRNNIKKIANELNITFLDTYEEIFKKYENKNELLSYYLPLHLNATGYRLVSEFIYKKINN